MYVDEIMALMRFSNAADPVLANLARTILVLIERLRDAELRAEIAEASLDAERAARLEAEAALARLAGEPSA